MKNYLFIGIAAVIIALSVFGLVKLVGLTNPTKMPTQNVGAVPTLDGVDTPFITVNGEREWRGRVPMTATSSVVCSFGNPFNATSTVSFPIRFSITTNGLGAQNVYISTSTTNAASSTNAWTGALPTGTGTIAYAVFQNTATTSATASAVSTGDVNILPGMTSVGASNYILGPTERLNLKVATSTAGVFAAYLSGSCSAVIKRLN